MKEDFIKNLIRILERSDIDSIELSSFWGKNKIKLFKQSATQAFSSPLSPKDMHEETTNVNVSSQKPSNLKVQNIDNLDNAQVSEPDVAESKNLHYITAPLVGTFYLSPKPGEPPFIKVGDKIEPGKIVCIIEAMKIFNEIESDITGSIKEILIDDSNPVEYGQKIISVELDD